MDENEFFETCQAMRTYGGSFVAALADCLMRADMSNRARLLAAFPEYVTKYSEMARMGRTPA